MDAPVRISALRALSYSASGKELIIGLTTKYSVLSANTSFRLNVSMISLRTFRGSTLHQGASTRKFYRR